MEVFEANGRTFKVVRAESKNRNAWARLRDDVLTITIPSRWPVSEKKRLGDDLLAKAVKAIEQGKWTGETTKKVEFTHGQRIEAFGRRIDISFKPGKRFCGKTNGDLIEVVMDDDHPKKHEKASAIAKERLIGMLMPELKERIYRINDAHFRAIIKRITVRDNISRWGSCSRDGSVSFNLRLLFMPEGILDYVIVHELAHTRYRSHGSRFWALVEKVMPDHMERRKWLKENGWSYPKDGESACKEMVAAKKDGQLRIADFIYEEPY